MERELLIDKYKPTKLNEMIGNSNILSSLSKSVSNNIFHNILLYGDTGLGKTNIASIYSKMVIKNVDDYYESNPYDDRNLNVIHYKLTSFTSKKSNNIKVIFIDEIDTILENTQNVISNFLDMDNLIFIFTSNTLDNISETIQSNCILYKLEPISDIELTNYLKLICKKENILYDDNGIKSLLFSANGDVRVLLNNLNLTNSAYKYVNETNVFKICNIPEKKLLLILIEYLKKKNIYKSINLTKTFLKMGYNCSDILINLYHIMIKADIDEELKLFILAKINNTLYTLSTITCTELQIYELYAQICCND